MASVSSSQARQGWSIVLASREVWPFVEGGGIGRGVWATAQLLAPHADVTVLTSERSRARFESLSDAGDPRLSAGVRYAFAAEPEGDLSPFVSWHHAWSDALLRRTAELFPDGGPDVAEIPDYQGEGFAFAHAIRGGDPRVRRTRLALRLSTSAEMCIALNEDPADESHDVLRGIERFPLRFADALLWPGGNSLDRYRDFYGADLLAPGVHCPLPTGDMLEPATAAKPPDGPLRLLYLNRLERRKGIEELVAAVRTLPDAELALTIVGRDTQSGPGGSSMLQHARALAAGDGRIVFAEQVPHTQVPDLIAAHHVVVVPSRWETFSYVTREALACNRPVLATPSGAIVDVVLPDRSGWLAKSASTAALAAALRAVVDDREGVDAMIADGRPRAVYEESARDEELLSAYERVTERPRTAAAHKAMHADAIVSLDDGQPLTATLAALEAQRDVDLGIVLALHGDGPGPDPAELARVHHVARTSEHGRPAAWASALPFTSADAVLLLPAGTVIEPDFVRRALAVLADEPDITYVTAFVGAGFLPWHAPFGSYSLPLADIDGGASVAVIRRSALLDLPSRPLPDEAALFAALARRGAVGLVLHEPLVPRLPKRLAARTALART
jgi:glycosyltransferase involved in cell wall biosynthesis